MNTYITRPQDVTAPMRTATPPGLSTLLPSSVVPTNVSRHVRITRYPVNALAAQFEHNLAVVVGINTYAYVRQLENARRDAERLALLLQDDKRDQHDRYEVISLYDEAATGQALRTLLTMTLPQRIAELGPRTA